IGVRHYDEKRTGWRELQHTGQDVVRLKRALLLPQTGYDPGNVLTISDDESVADQVDVKKADINTILDNVEKMLGDVVQPDDSVLLYFSGHGYSANTQHS